MFYIVLCLCSTDIEIKTVVKHWYDMTISISAQNQEKTEEAESSPKSRPKSESRSPNSFLTFCLLQKLSWKKMFFTVQAFESS